MTGPASQPESGKQPQDRSASHWIGKTIAYPENLPVSQRRDTIIHAIKDNPVIILAGETGSGKTTQIPKMCIDAGLGHHRMIACTQPRRVAALSVAKRVAEELEVDYGREVGCKIRFDDKTSRQTRVKFMTDGMLLAEVQSDPSLRQYDTIIIDEAHERSLNIDFLLGHLNQLRRKRPELKIIITSATIDTDKFSKVFDNAPIIEVSGRLYPVHVINAPLDELLDKEGDFIDGIVAATENIVSEFGQGDILAFLPTEKDIRETMDVLKGRFGHAMEILPCFGRLSSADQQKIFSRTRLRKLILATNIAETSLTIPGIRFVIDTGLARASRYNPRTRTKRLPIEKVSQSSANQRKGRCGRVEDGICIRLYSENDFTSRNEYTTPEIQRANLAEVILTMKASKLGDVETFPFIDPPSSAAIKAGYMLLQELGALNDIGELTPLGKRLSTLPVDPTVGRMLLQSERENVVEQTLVIAAALSIQDPRERPLGKEEAAKLAHKPFVHQQSDFLTLLNIWEAYHDQFERMTQSKLRKFCKEHFLSYLRMREWKDVYDQLKRSLAQFDRTQKTNPAPTQKIDPATKEQNRKYGGSEYNAIHHCLISGLLSNPIRKDEPNLYRATGGRKVMIFPGSGLFNRKAAFAKKKAAKSATTDKIASPEWALAGEVVETSRLYARTVAAIDPKWLMDLGEHIISRSYSQPIWDAKEGRVLAKESARIHGLEIQNKRVSYLKVDAKKATEIFIRDALLGEEFHAPYPFIEKNRNLMKRLQNAQTTFHVSSWIGTEEAAFRFYAQRLERVASVHDLNRVLKRHGDRQCDSLVMQEADLTSSMNEAVDLSAFPEAVALENSALPLEYSYNPGQEDDGVTLKVPYAKAADIESPLLDWMVPGHLKTKIEHLLRSLPKDIRRQLAPIAEKAEAISKRLKPSSSGLTETLSAFLKNEYAIETYASDWKLDAIPAHLQIRVEVVDKKGETVATGRDMNAVHAALEERSRQLPQTDSPKVESLFSKARSRYERDDITLADLKPTELKIEIGTSNGVPTFAFTGLRSLAGQVNLRLFKSEADARRSTRQAVGALILHELRYELAWIEKDLKDLNRLGPAAVVLAPMKQLQNDALAHIKKHLSLHNIDTIDPDQIRTQSDKAKAQSKGFLYRLVDTLKEILEMRQSMIADRSLPDDIKQEVERLLPPTFISETPHYALKRMKTYLLALHKRADTRLRDPQRDRKWAQEVDALRKRLYTLSPTIESFRQDKFEELRWMIEEYAVSIFAQKLGTAYPVSEKRIEKKFAALESKRDPNATSSAQATNTPPQAKENQKPIDRPTSKDLENLKKLFG